MDLAERVRARARGLKAGRGRAAPTATLQVALRAGAWSAGAPPARLAGLCLAAAQALGADPLLGGRRASRRSLEAPDGPRLWVGPEGGRVWRALGAAELALGPAALAARLVDAAPDADGGRSPGLEILDLSTLGALEWRGVLLGGALGRLCLLAPRPVPAADDPAAGVEALGLALDFDVAWCEAGRAARFLAALAAALGAERVGCASPI